MRLSAQSRLRLIKSVLTKEKTVTQACKEASISRKTFYKWLKRYQEAPSNKKLQALSDKEWSLTLHGRKISANIEKKVLDVISEKPDIGYRNIQKDIDKKLGKRISVHAIKNILERNKVKEIKKRREYQEKKIVKGLTPQDRYLLFQAVIKEGISVAKACKKFGISRKTFYKWYKRYKKTQEFNIETFKDKKWRIGDHPRKIPKEKEERILSLIIEKPEFSSHKIAETIGIGNHGVQNVLQRHNLNLLEKRLAFAKAQRPVVEVPAPTGWIDRVRYVLEQFVPTLAPAPPPVPFGTGLRQVLTSTGLRQVLTSIWLRTLFNFLKTFSITSVISSATVYSFIWWINYITSLITPEAVGTLFATIALVNGTLFFLYSMKYYLTLAVVLSFSQQETGKGQDLPAGKAGVNGKRKGIMNWLLGMGNGDVKSQQVDTTSQAVGLTPNLEHIVLKRKPYISVHIPFYNEKNVVRRALEAATNFDYPEYEVILCDDSTDKTSQIIRDYLKKVNGKELKVKENRKEGWTLTQAEVRPSGPDGPQGRRPGVTLKHLHRTSRSGFKGGALREALRVSDPRAEFIVVFDADFVPYPDTLELFLKYFQVTAGSLDFAKRKSTIVNSKSKNNPNNELPITDYGQQIAAIQGYQWHVLNKSENWITRGIRSEYAGNYVIERSGREIYSGLKMISGAVYMVRRDVLDEVGWETSITEDFQLTLKLYEKGYKVVYTPYIQAPAECVSTLKRLIRQRMRWAEGHSNNVRKMFVRLLVGKWEEAVSNSKLVSSNSDKKTQITNYHLPITKQRVFVPSPLTLSEKLEFLYLSPYYLQAFFFLIGTLSWLISETLFPARLPFWTSLWGWSLVLTNFISLPLMNAVGLFLEESEEKDYQGIASFIALSYIMVPFQAYASIKGLLKKEEGPWFRTPKTGRITDIIARGRFYRFISGILPGRAQPAIARQGIATRVEGLGKIFLYPIPYTLNPYLALSSANSQFNSFKVKPKKMRWIGKAGVSLVVLLALFVNYLGLFVQPTQAAAPGGEWWDTNYQYRKKITVTAGSTGVPNSYSVSLTFNHYDLATTQGKSLTNGNDVRVAYWNGSGWTELDRALQEGSAWNDTSTIIWFKIQAAISASSSDDNYYLYYDYDLAGSPPANKSNIYDFWDDFDNGSLEAGWSFDAIGSPVGGATNESGTVVTISATTTGDLWSTADQAYHLTRSKTGDFLAESYTVGPSGTHGSWSKYGGVHLRDTTAAGSKNRIMCETYSVSQGSTNSYRLATDATTDEQYGERYDYNRLTRIGGTSRAFNSNDGITWNEIGTSITFTGGLPDPVRIGPTLAAMTTAAAHSVDVDWFKIRLYVGPEPTTALDTEEQVPEVVLLLLPLAILLPTVFRKLKGGELLSFFIPSLLTSNSRNAEIDLYRKRRKYKNKDPG